VAVVTARSIPELIRDLNAEARAKQMYARWAGELFELEDQARADGYPNVARMYHESAITAGHAAWAEDADPEPR